ncbi:hypothetical protein ACFQ2B_27850 [Streptomyces stramineus]
MVAFPNPVPHEVRSRDHLGTIWQAARVAGVKPGTIRVWMTRRKIEPMALGDDGPELFHLPTIAEAAQVKSGRPRRAA